MRAAEVLNRYAKGERNFQGANLKGLNFRNQDLSGADFSRADIRGTNFQDANLTGCKFVEIKKAGLTTLWIFIHSIGCSVLIALCSILLASFTFQVPYLLLTQQEIVGEIYIIAIVCSLGGSWYLFVRKGFGGVANTFAFAFAFTVSALGALAAVGAFAEAVGFAFAVVFTVVFLFLLAFVVAGALAVSFALAFAVSFAVSFVLASAVSFVLAFAVSFALAFAFAVEEYNSTTVLLIGSLLLLLQISLSILVALRALKGDQRYAWIYKASLTWSSYGGTSFRGANLTHADFRDARPKNVDLRAKAMYQTVWTGVDPNVHLTRTEGTYLSNRRVRDLVRTGQGKRQSFDRLDLRGINLSQAKLDGCSFRTSDLSGANLQGANLTDATLVQTQLDQADLGQATLTGAMIEDWGLTSNTRLDGVCCRYVFMKEIAPSSTKNRRRKPDDWNQEFEDGDFADFIKPLTDTLDLYHNRNVDPRAIAIAFKHLSDNNPDAQLQIVAMESRGADKFMLRAKTDENAHKSELSSQYFQTYDQVRALPPNEQLKLLLAEKDSRIQSLERLLEKAIDRPNFLQIEQNQGDYMSGQGNINISQDDRSINVGGDMTGNVVGDQNTADIQLQSANLPKPQTVNIHQELATLKQLLTQLQSDDQRKISNALSDAEDELNKPQPDKDEVGQALGRALDYAQKAEGFASSIDKLRPHVQNAAAWLGKNWYKLLAIVGLAA